jgi:hypothetical protein
MANLLAKIPTVLEELINSFLDTDSRVGLVLALGVESKQASLYKPWVINPRDAIKTFHRNILFQYKMYHTACDPDINHIYSLICRNNIVLLQHIVRFRLVNIPNDSRVRMLTHGFLPDQTTKKLLLQLSQAIRKVIVLGVGHMYFVENNEILFDNTITQKTKLIRFGIYQKQVLRSKLDQSYFDD